MRKETEDRLRLWIVGLCIIELFVLVNMIMVASASEITLSPSTINLTIYSGENKTVNIMLESDTTTTVEITHKITKNTSNLQGFHIAYPREFKVERNREVTVPVAVWLDENFGPNNITINFQANMEVAKGAGSSTGRGYNNTTFTSNGSAPSVPIVPNETRGSEPWKEPSVTTNKSTWLWWLLLIIGFVIVSVVGWLVWRRHQLKKQEEELNEEEQHKKEVKK